MGTIPSIFPFWKTTALFSSVEFITTGIPTMETISICRVLFIICIKAISASSNSKDWPNKSAQVYPVILSSGKMIICTPFPSAMAIWVSICCALNLQSATFTIGMAAATLTKPYFILYLLLYIPAKLIILSRFIPLNKKNKKKCVIYLFVANNYLSLHMK